MARRHFAGRRKLKLTSARGGGTTLPVAGGAAAPAWQQPRDLLLAIAVPREVGFLLRLRSAHRVLASPLARVVAWSAAAVPAL